MIDREAAIDELLAKEALRDLAMRYSRAIDRRDMELLRSVYHADAVDEHGTVFKGTVDEFIAAQSTLMADFEITAHHIANMSYRIDGDRADGELYFTAYHRTRGEAPQNIIVHGRYLDNYERRQGVWKIANRWLAWDSFIVLDAAAELPQLRALGAGAGTVDDLSYRVLPLMGRGR